MKSIVGASAIAMAMSVFTGDSIAQPMPAAQTVAPSVDLPIPQFDAAYEDNGIQVYITKVMQPYQMQAGQQIASLMFARTDPVFSNDFERAGFIPVTHRVFHSVPDDAPEIAFTPVIAGTREQITIAFKRESANKITGLIGAVAMFAVSRGTSGGTGAIANLSGLQAVAGSGMLQSANLNDPKVAPVNNKDIPSGNTNIIYFAKLVVKHSQSDMHPEESEFYFVLPYAMRGEVINGKTLRDYQQSPNFSPVLLRAIRKAANLMPASKV